MPLIRQVGERAEFVVNGTPFSLLGRGESSGGQIEPPGRLFLLAKDLEKVRKSAEAWGGRLVEGPEERETSDGKARWAAFQDPEGNVLEIMQPL